ncbi:DUF885 family protein [Catalinimonas sp. 4WD22]|uniref:DUF885 family protein n=1 Tax=Catalinimonas locisalis TaxID=3133978 RepID=UPI003101AB9D
MKHITLLLLLSLLSLPVSAQNINAENLYHQTSEINNLMVPYQSDYGILSRFYNINTSPERINRLQSLMQDYLDQLERINFNELTTGSSVDYLLFRKKLAENLNALNDQLTEINNAKNWVAFASIVYDINQERRRGKSLNAQETAAKVDSLSTLLQTSIANLSKKDSLDSRLAKPAIEVVNDLQKAMQDIYDFYHGYDPMFSWWVEQPYHLADSLFSTYIDSLNKKSKVISSQQRDSSGIVGNPIGREEIIRQLENEMIPYTPEELIEIANIEFAWCDEQMLQASEELGFGNDWHAALEKVKNSYVPPGKQPELILRLYNESVDFLKENELITIPPLAEESWRMMMMSPERQLINPFFLGGETIIISYPTNTMSHKDKLMSMRGNNPHFSRSTVHHELIAGHGLQFFMNNRHKAYRSFYTPFWIEGWALYWERLLWDLGFPETPEDRIGMLFWRMHRCARIIFSLKYHLGEWSPQQCIDFLVERVGHERANAEGEVRRSFEGGYSPLYQLAYMIGGLQFEALKEELVDSGKMTFRGYHDAVLRENAMPVEMLRAILLNESPKKNFKTKWRFYELP